MMHLSVCVVVKAFAYAIGVGRYAQQPNIVAQHFRQPTRRFGTAVDTRDPVRFAIAWS